MKIGYYAGAMYAEIEGEEIDSSPIELGDKILNPGKFVNKLGEKKRTSFEMKEGWYLRFVGTVEEYLLFDTNCDSESNKKMYYCFAYIDKNTLLICSQIGCRDVRIEKLEVFDNVKMQHLNKQLSIF